MKTKLIFFSCVLAFTLLSFDMPDGWFEAGSHPNHYEMGIEKGAGTDGTNVATIKSKKNYSYGFGTLMQTSLPDRYHGKRVRMTGLLRTTNVKSWAGMWFRVDGPNPHKSLAFDNMWPRGLKGDNDWKEYSIVLDVPANATLLAYGVLLNGGGQVWFDRIKFEVVDKTVPTTDQENLEPTNLDFDKKGK